MFNIPVARSVLAQVLREAPGFVIGRSTTTSDNCLLLVASRHFSAKTSPVVGSSLVTRRSHVTSTRHSAEATLAPEVTFENVRTLKKPIRRVHLPPNIKFTYCPQEYLDTGIATPTWKSQVLATETDSYSITHDTFTQAEAARPLVLIFGWMLSKDKHIDKYRRFWYQRGFDVLSIRTGPTDLLLPSLGGAHIARVVYDFLAQQRPKYDEILVHAFSVGGYQMAEVLRRINEKIAEGDAEAERLYDSFKGWMIDSVVFADDCGPGLSRAITLHPVIQPMIEKSIHTWLKLTKSFTLNRYYDVESLLVNNERRVPAMLLFSEDDVVSNYKWNHRVVDGWGRNGTLSARKCWKSSVHVLHYKEHPEEYEEAVDKFVQLLDIKKRFEKKVNVELPEKK